MTTSNLAMLERLGLGVNEETPSDEHDGSSEYRAFGVNRRAGGSEAMLDVVLRSGDHQTFAYMHLYRMAFNPEVGISLFYSEHHIEIQGRYLLDLHRHLRTHRVTFIAEADGPTAKLMSPATPLITTITVQKNQLELPMH